METTVEREMMRRGERRKRHERLLSQESQTAASVPARPPSDCAETVAVHPHRPLLHVANHDPSHLRAIYKGVTLAIHSDHVGSAG